MSTPGRSVVERGKESSLYWLQYRPVTLPQCRYRSRWVPRSDHQRLRHADRSRAQAGLRGGGALQLHSRSFEIEHGAATEASEAHIAIDHPLHRRRASSIPEISGRSRDRRRWLVATLNRGDFQIGRRTGLVSSQNQRSRSGFSPLFVDSFRIISAKGIELPLGESHSTLTARAASRTTIVSEISDCSIMRPFAQRVTGAVSVGEKAVLVLKAMNR